MSAKTQHNNILLAVIGFTAVVIIVAFIGFLTIGHEPEIIQGEVEVSEYRVSSKLPGRIVELRVKEGDFVHVGDTLAILEVPEVDAQKKVAEATGEATQAVQSLTDAGARKEQIQGAYELLQQARAASDIAQKTYTRMQNLYNEGVISGQKRDEAFAAYKATEAQVKAAQSQYDMARNGARRQEKEIAAKNAQAARSAVDVVSSLLRETVQVAQAEGEVSEVYPKVGELVGMGSPIMTISMMNDLWGTFNIREDLLPKFQMGKTVTVMIPGIGKKDIDVKIYYIRDMSDYAVWRSTKVTGQYDSRTFEIKARPVDREKSRGLRPGMSAIYNL